MKKYQSQVSAVTGNVIGKLVYTYPLYNIWYSDDGLVGRIGDFSFNKENLKGIGVCYDDKRLCDQSFNAYHIKFHGFEPLDTVIDARNQHLLFSVLAELDLKAHAEYTKRQKRKQLITSIKSFPGQIAKKLGWQK